MKEPFFGWLPSPRIFILRSKDSCNNGSQRLTTGAVFLQPFSQLRHVIGPLARLSRGGFGVKAIEASAALPGLRLINLFDELWMRRRFAPAPISRGEIVLGSDLFYCRRE